MVPVSEKYKKSLFFSLLASAHAHLKALIVDTGKQLNEELPDLLRRVNQASGKKLVHTYDKKTEDVRFAPRFRIFTTKTLATF